MKYYVLIVICLFTALSTFAQDKESLLNRLLAPGPLIEGHKDLESTGCLDCHDAGKGVPDSKCLECHKEINKFVVKQKGYHGTLKRKCMECHKDHKGRTYDSTKFDWDAFDHNLTGMPLRGKHEELKCAECHTGKRGKKAVRKNEPLFLGESKSCKECHLKDDIHLFKGKFAKKDCNACHGDRSWKRDLKFNHNRNTTYQIKGAHAKLKCQDCHNTKGKKGPSRYEWKNLKTSQCLSCHEDQHGKKLGPKFQGGKKCTTCHTVKTWKIKKFDHYITGYKIKGKHATLSCKECHRQSPSRRTPPLKDFSWVGLKQKCSACHSDFHKFAGKISKKLGPLLSCDKCHNEQTWKKNIRFDHDRDTVFGITGKHMDLKCNKCHVGEKWKAIRGKKTITQRKYHWKLLSSKTCENCHKSPHKNEFSKKFLQKKCTECHTTSGWKNSPFKAGKNFKHDETRFKLTGTHRTLTCNQCHRTRGGQVFKFKSFSQGFCIDCHKNPHKNQFHKKFSQKKCTDCHGTTKFSRLKKFNHAQTRFKLSGQHKKLKCTECHTSTGKKKISPYVKKTKDPFWRKYVFHNFKSKDCTQCHKDYHQGQLSKNCTQCHNDKSWEKVKFSHNRDSDFRLVGKHKSVSCKECHQKIKGAKVQFGPKGKVYPVRRWKPLPDSCYACHKKDDPHKGSFGKSCNECHIEKGWKRTKDFHRDFTLSGVHFTLNCNECHTNDRHLGGTSDNCSFCHQKDDIHSGNLPQCGECHYERFWEHTKFRHSLTNFPLRGQHRTLDCFSCHSGGVYQGTPLSCTECHANEVDDSNFDHATILNLQDCNECHNQFTFER